MKERERNSENKTFIIKLLQMFECNMCVFVYMPLQQHTQLNSVENVIIKRMRNVVCILHQTK